MGSNRAHQHPDPCCMSNKSPPEKTACADVRLIPADSSSLKKTPKSAITQRDLTTPTNFASSASLERKSKKIGMRLNLVRAESIYRRSRNTGRRFRSCRTYRNHTRLLRIAWLRGRSQPVPSRTPSSENSTIRLKSRGRL